MPAGKRYAVGPARRERRVARRVAAYIVGRCRRARRRGPRAVARVRGSSVEKTKPFWRSPPPHPPHRPRPRPRRRAIPATRGLAAPRGSGRGAARPPRRGVGQTRSSAARCRWAASLSPHHATGWRGGGGGQWPNRLPPRAARQVPRTAAATGAPPSGCLPPPHPQTSAAAAAPPTARPPPWLGPLAAWPSSRATGALGPEARPSPLTRACGGVAALAHRAPLVGRAGGARPPRIDKHPRRSSHSPPRERAACDLLRATWDLLWVIHLLWTAHASAGSHTLRYLCFSFSFFFASHIPVGSLPRRMALTGIRTATSSYLEDTLRITHPPRSAVGRGLPRPRRNGAARTACRQLGRRWCRCQCQPLPCETLGNEVACAGNGAVEGGGDVEGWQIRLFCSLYTPEIQASTSTAVGAPLEMQGAHLLCASPSWPTIPLLPGGHAVTDQRGSHSLGVFAATVGYFSEASATAAGRASTRACCRWHCWHWAPSPPRLMAQTPSDPTAATAVPLIVACGRGATRPQARRGGSPTFFSAQAAGGCACQPGALLVAAAGYR